MMAMYKGHPESKEYLHIQSAHLFCCSPLVSDVQCDVEKCLMQLYVGPCHVVSAEIAVAKDESIETVRCKVLCFLQADEILDYLAEEASSRMELFYCTTMHTAWQTQALLHEQFHLDILEHPPYSPDLAPSEFFVSKNEGVPYW